MCSPFGLKHNSCAAGCHSYPWLKMRGNENKLILGNKGQTLLLSEVKGPERETYNFVQEIAHLAWYSIGLIHGYVLRI